MFFSLKMNLQCVVILQSSEDELRELDSNSNYRQVAISMGLFSPDSRKS